MSESNTWYNYSQYLNSIYLNITSLEDYLSYFNPSFALKNTTIYSIESNTLEEERVTLTKNIDTWIDNSEPKVVRTIIQPNTLELREGYFNGDYDVKIYCGEISESTPFSSIWEDAIDFPVNTSLIRIKRSTQENESIDNFQIIANPTAGLYIPQTQNGHLAMKYISDGQRSLGDTLYFALESSVSRYYSTAQNSWGTNTTFSVASATRAGGQTTNIIQNINGVVWSNSYPLMSECYIESEDSSDTIIEEFIFDKDITVTQTNFENQNAFVYNINARNITNDEIKKWKDFVKVIIL